MDAAFKSRADAMEALSSRLIGFTTECRERARFIDDLEPENRQQIVEQLSAENLEILTDMAAQAALMVQAAEQQLTDCRRIRDQVVAARNAAADNAMTG